MLKHKHIHGLARRRIRKLFTADLPLKSRTILFGELDSCPSCAKYYVDFNNAESALCSAVDGVTPFVLERTETALFESLEITKPRPITNLRIAIAGATCAIATMLVLFFVPLTQSTSTNRVTLDQHASLAPIELVARGGSTGSSLVGIRVFKVDPDGGVSQDGLVSINDIITFTYTRSVPGKGYLALFGIQKGGEVLWYYPDYDKQASIPIDGSVVDEPLGDGIDLGVNHATGDLRIVAAFSAQPLDVGSIEKGISKIADGDIFSPDLKPVLTKTLSIEVAEHSVMINLEQEGN